ncbi:hypothetical protein PGLA_08400 [Paenibacillus glacialis]|uniref:Uncharacterized protein n=2 Tax=Paenibacillus glacialis TaxID=494026 RepID=A0A168LST9_9BACL|nr:hypothetical protein PGLA_08400 [Paenibacillus glacialis]
MRKQIVQVILLSLFLTACKSQSQPNNVDPIEKTPVSSEAPAVKPTSEPSSEPISEPQIEPEKLEKVSVLPYGISYYQGDEHMDGIGETNKPANFKRHPYIPYGFYIYESMEEYKLEDGTEWGMDNQRSLFSLFDKEQISVEPNFMNPSLTKYKEYIGSDKDEYGSYYDFFGFHDRGRDLVVRTHYFEEDKNRSLPMFLDVLRSIHYISDPKAFRSGIDFDFPAGTDSDEEEVIKLVKKNVEAMVSKDKAVFRSTLTSSDVNYLDFLIDTPIKYRFTKLEMIEPYDDSTGRRNIRIRYDYLEDGIVKQSGNIFTSLKGKDGKWKIANID